MEPLTVECLGCGTVRKYTQSFEHDAEPECPRCGYLGWAPVESLTERDRRTLRVRPPERRRLRVA